jgi:hypothetical protein
MVLLKVHIHSPTIKAPKSSKKHRKKILSEKHLKAYKKYILKKQRDTLKKIVYRKKNKANLWWRSGGFSTIVAEAAPRTQREYVPCVDAAVPLFH